MYQELYMHFLIFFKASLNKNVIVISILQMRRVNKWWKIKQLVNVRRDTWTLICPTQQNINLTNCNVCPYSAPHYFMSFLSLFMLPRIIFSDHHISPYIQIILIWRSWQMRVGIWGLFSHFINNILYVRNLILYLYHL